MTDEPGRAASAAAFLRADAVAICALIGGFLGVVWWFAGVDFYHRHYFDAGPIVFADNLVRIVFVGIFTWLIYAPGAVIAALITPQDARSTLLPAERAVLGFGIGVGIWHVVMLLLGIFNLYYWAVVVALCLAILIVSAKHFGRVAVAGSQALAARFAELRQGRASPPAVGAILIAVAVAWLLLRRGLFPGGGGDYYEHYFYYYLEVLKNHGLQPNDVWYQYYYSKGSGLAFLGMLLTDPEAPALTTFPCVICAALAIAWSTNVDSYRMVPGCLIESVLSFKLSGRLDEILGGDPELAKQRLQEAGLNYFLFMKDYRIIDLLPFSRLFAPDTIGRYLGIKWSDGSSYLLTWAGPGTTSLKPDFLDAYARRRAEPDPLGWFRFDALAPQIIANVPRLRSATHWGEASELLTWR